jgi:hypothetical protein
MIFEIKLKIFKCVNNNGIFHNKKERETDIEIHYKADIQDLEMQF